MIRTAPGYGQQAQHTTWGSRYVHQLMRTQDPTPAVTVKAYLEGYPRVADSVTLSTNVIHVFSLDAEAEYTEIETNPGEIWLFRRQFLTQEMVQTDMI